MLGEARRARIGVSVVFAVCGAAFATWASRVPSVQERSGASIGQLAIALFGLAAGSVITLALAGPLITKVGSKRASLLGMTVLCGGLPVVALAPDPGWLTAALFLLGAGNSLLDVSMNAHAARVEAEYDRPIFAGFHAFWNIGGLAGSGVSAALAALRVPVTVHFPIVAALTLLAGMLAVTGLFLRGPDTGQGGPAFTLPGRKLLPLGVIAFCGFVAEGTVNDWSAVYLTDTTDATAGLASLGYFAFSITMIMIRLVADRVTGRIGATRVVRVAAVITVAGFTLTLAIPSSAAGIAGFGLIGLGVSAMVPLAWSAASRLQPESPGTAISAVAACGYLGFLAGPVLIGGLAGLVGLRLALLAVVLLMVVVYALAPALRVRRSVGVS